MSILSRCSALVMTCLLTHSLFPLQAFAHEAFKTSAVEQQRDQSIVISSRQVQLTRAESALGIVTIDQIMPHLNLVNQRYSLYKPAEFNAFVKNFHYPFRDRFDLSRSKPPAHVVLHWTANKRPDIPLYTLSAFMRSRRGGRIQMRDNKYKNVSNYFLTGSITAPDGSKDAHLVKLTRGDVASWGDIPRVTAYPTDNQWDDNKYDGRGALGIEIESPDFRTFYYHPEQKRHVHNFLVMVLQERGELDAFRQIRYSEHWSDMLSLHRYLKSHLASIDVNKKGGIPVNYQHLDQILKNFPDLSPGVYQEAQRIFSFISGHGIVAREYNARMHRTGRPQDARYHKIDFTEAHVFVVAMDLLNSSMSYQGIDMPSEFHMAQHRAKKIVKPEPKKREKIWVTSPAGRLISVFKSQN